MNIIIQFAKDRKFKSIRLEDRSIFNCLDSENKMKYDLKNVHILTHGVPFYYKFGFKFTEADQHKIIKKNYNKIKNLKTKDLNIDTLINIIRQKTNEFKQIHKPDTVNFNDLTISNIKILYDVYYELEICRFFSKFSRYFCELMSLIWKKLFEVLNLEISNAELMILDLKSNQIKSNQIKLNQIKSNQIKSNLG